MPNTKAGGGRGLPRELSRYCLQEWDEAARAEERRRRATQELEEHLASKRGCNLNE
jgi:hypothetical protein